MTQNLIKKGWKSAGHFFIFDFNQQLTKIILGLYTTFSFISILKGPAYISANCRAAMRPTISLLWSFRCPGNSHTHAGGCCDHQESFITLTCLFTEITISNDRMFVIGKVLEEIKNYEGVWGFYFALSARISLKFLQLGVN